MTMAGKRPTLDELKTTKSLSDIVSEGKERRSALRGVDKTAVTVTSKDAGGSSIAAASGVPTSDQLERINSFTRSPKTADEVYVINTLSANTLPDRDDDYFDSDTLKGFAELPQPFSSVGKSYMVGHDYSKLPTGRIFGVGTKAVDGVDFLTHEVYIPNTDANKAFIENVDFGVNWAVSVGVMLDAQLCSICKEPQYGGWFFGGVCENGHVKGEYYDPIADPKDKYGYAIPVEPGTPGATKCLGNMHGAQDFYELSQVFLGAQFFAGLDSTKGVVKAFKTMKGLTVPVLGLSAAEASELPLQHADPKVADAIARFGVSYSDGGAMKWTDDQGLVYTYSPGDEVLCLGKSAEGSDDANEGGDEDGTRKTDEAADGAAGGSDEAGDADGEPSVDDAGSAEQGDPAGDDSGEQAGADNPERPVGEVTPAESSSEDDDASGEGSVASDDSESDTEKEISMDKAAVLAAAHKAKMPERFLSAVAEATDSGLEAVLRAAQSEITSLTTQITGLSTKAALGDAYLTARKAEAVNWYVKARSLGDQKGVNTAAFEKILDTCGDNIELIDSMIADNQALAESKLPGIRRSSFPDNPYDAAKDPNSPVAPSGDNTTSRSAATVSRIHG